MAADTQLSTGQAPTSDAVPPSPVSRWRRVADAAFWLLMAGLLALNGWWLWQSRPLPSLQSVSGWVQLKQYDRAESALRAMLKRSPHDGDARVMLARVLAAQDDPLSCAEQLHLVPAWWPTKPDALYREGQAYLEANHAVKAEQALQACIAPNPLHPAPPGVFSDAALELLKIYVTEERWDDMHEVIWRAYEEAQPVDHPAILGMWLRGEIERITHEEAARVLRGYLQAEPDNWQALRALARNEQELRQPAEALRDIEAARKLRPRDPRVWRDYLWILHEQGNAPGFAAAVEQLPEGWQTNAELWSFRGLALEKTGKLTEAASAFEHALALAPAEPEYHYRLAQVEERQGQKALAQKHRDQSKVLREARASLRDAYKAVIDAYKHPDTPGTSQSQAVNRLADLCQTLGWTRLATAWRKLLPPQSLSEYLKS